MFRHNKSNIVPSGWLQTFEEKKPRTIQEVIVHPIMIGWVGYETYITHVCFLKSCNRALRDFRIFLDAPLNPLTRVDILLGTKVMSLAFTSSFSPFRKHVTCYCNCVIAC